MNKWNVSQSSKPRVFQFSTKTRAKYTPAAAENSKCQHFSNCDGLQNTASRFICAILIVDFTHSQFPLCTFFSIMKENWPPPEHSLLWLRRLLYIFRSFENEKLLLHIHLLHWSNSYQVGFSNKAWVCKFASRKAHKVPSLLKSELWMIFGARRRYMLCQNLVTHRTCLATFNQS